MPTSTSRRGHPSSPGQAMPLPLSDQLDNIDRRLAALPAALFFNIPTGFPALDEAFGGGLAAQDLMLIGGKQNVGKTILALQIARNIAVWAKTHNHPLLPWVVSYEHDDWDLLSRLICMESLIQLRERGAQDEVPVAYWEINKTVREVKRALNAGNAQPPEKFLDSLFAHMPASALQSLIAIGRYMPHLMLSLGDRTYTTVQSIEEMVAHYRIRYGRYVIPVIDYLQTIPPPISLVQQAVGSPEIVHASNIGAIKDLAMRQHVSVIAVAAVEEQALKAQRAVHIEDIFGPLQAQYTPDRVIMLNPDGESEGDIRLSLEKNRRGPSNLSWQHARIGAQFYIEPDGEGPLQEQQYR